ncbi:hypothetical protein DSO57_1003188 [Entomophthora muscae]|uniref:Uncharacterized protein n=1 Tax=Entomophthora muscae TaxID=34485 RepID=A0ACC2SAN1_9FUNG|nr:hypothetical protein DSO57_1003188 [Entomophthora muscae]
MGVELSHFKNAIPTQLVTGFDLGHPMATSQERHTKLQRDGIDQCSVAANLGNSAKNIDALVLTDDQNIIILSKHILYTMSTKGNL